MTLSPVKRQKLPDSVVERLLALLRSGELACGERLPAERTLSAQLGVSRTSLRDALARLELMGYLEVRQGGGTVVRAPSAETLCLPFQGLLRGLPRAAQDLLEFRRMLEPEAAALAAQRRSPEQLAGLHEGLRRQRLTAARGLKLADEDLQFHGLIADMVGNTVILRVLETLQELMQQLRSHTLAGLHPDLTLEEHARILHAIERGSAESARQAMTAHLTSVIRTATELALPL